MLIASQRGGFCLFLYTKKFHILIPKSQKITAFSGLKT